MTTTSRFAFNRVFLALKFATIAPLVIFSEHSMALYMENDDLIFNNQFLKESVFMQHESTLTLNGGGSFSIEATSDSTLNLNGAHVQGDGSVGAVWLTDSSAFINDSTITAKSTEIGLLLGHDQGGSVAHVNNSTITGGEAGALVSRTSELILNASTLIGTNADGAGLKMFDGSVSASNGSLIRGALNGVQVLSNGVGEQGNLILSGSRVVGDTGSAIVIDDLLGASTVDIVLRDGTTLSGGNGTMLEANNGSKVMLSVFNSALTGDVRINSGSSLNFALSQASMTGDVVVEAGSSADLSLSNSAVLTGRLINVNSLALNSQAQWVLVEDSSVGQLNMSGGSVRFGQPGDFYKLSVDELSGSGTFYMEADFSKGQSDLIEVTGEASGQHEIVVHSSGADPLSDSSLHLVSIASGTAQFALQGGEVDLGTWSYGLSQEGNNWYLDATTRKISPGTRTALAIFDAGPTVLLGEMSTLRSRMGEIRMNDSKAGGWMRTYGNKFQVSAQGTGYSQVQQGLAFGVDAPLPYGDGQWLIGLLGGYSTSDLDMGRGTSGSIDSYYAGLYSTWLQPESGYYVDGVLKFNRFQNEADVQMSDGIKSKGDFDNGAVSASLEVGRHIKLDDGWFVEPYGQVIGALIQGRSYDLDNGMEVEGDASRSLLGKLGVTVGRDVLLSNQMRVQPYVRAAIAHEFVGNNEVEVNDNRFDNDLSGSRGELGAGISLSLTDRVQVHADFDYSNGDRIEQPWGANVGVRYNW